MTLPDFTNSKLFLYELLVLLAVFCRLGALVTDVLRGGLKSVSVGDRLAWEVSSSYDRAATSTAETEDTASSAPLQKAAVTKKRSRYFSSRFISDSKDKQFPYKSFTSIHKFHTDKESPWQGRSIHIAGIAVCSGVKIILKRVQNILYSGIDLKIEAFI